MSSVSVNPLYLVSIIVIVQVLTVAFFAGAATRSSVRSRTTQHGTDSVIKPTCSDTSAPSLSTLLLDNVAAPVRFTQPSELRKRNE